MFLKLIIFKDKAEKEKTFTKATVKATKETGINPVKLFFTYVQENKAAEVTIEY